MGSRLVFSWEKNNNNKLNNKLRHYDWKGDSEEVVLTFSWFVSRKHQVSLSPGLVVQIAYFWMLFSF